MASLQTSPPAERTTESPSLCQALSADPSLVAAGVSPAVDPETADGDVGRYKAIPRNQPYRCTSHVPSSELILGYHVRDAEINYTLEDRALICIYRILPDGEIRSPKPDV